MIISVRTSNKVPFNSYLNYKAAAVYGGTTDGDFYTYYCEEGSSVIAYPEGSIFARYADVGIIFLEIHTFALLQR